MAAKFGALQQTNISNIATEYEYPHMFSRKYWKYIFNPGPFSIAMLVFPSAAYLLNTPSVWRVSDDLFQGREFAWFAWSTRQYLEGKFGSKLRSFA